MAAAAALRVPALAQRAGQACRAASNRQLRLSRGHPSTWAAKGYTPKPPAPLDPLTWEPKEVQKPSHGWIAPMGGTPADIPFKVSRTAKGKQLPVYTDYKNGRTRVLTVVRKVAGDVEVAGEELKKVCQGADVQLKAGRVEVKGHWAGPIRDYLYGLGF
ncbi:img2 [Symbiodinium sp. KB8]|nr:img2 [Symbiodinium sp. KB8]